MVLSFNFGYRAKIEIRKNWRWQLQVPKKSILRILTPCYIYSQQKNMVGCLKITLVTRLFSSQVCKAISYKHGLFKFLVWEETEDMISFLSNGKGTSSMRVERKYSGPCVIRPPLLRAVRGLSWGCGLISGYEEESKLCESRFQSCSYCPISICFLYPVFN